MFAALLPILGGWIGHFFGAVGAAWGWLAGSLVGALFSKQKVTDGPKLKDLDTTTSEYGEPINILYGTAKLGVSIVAATDLIPYTEKVAVGKTGWPFKKTVYQKVQKYKASFLCLLCDRKIDSVNAIFANDNILLYDVRSTATAQTQTESAAWASNHLEIYYGTDFQVMSSDFQALFPNYPQYRGRALVYLKDLPLEEFGNQIPKITVVASESSTTIPDTWADLDDVTTYPTFPGLPNDMLLNRISHGVIVFADKLRILGGWNENSGAPNGSLTSTWETEDGETWEAGTDLNVARSIFVPFQLGEMLVLAGGFDGSDTYYSTQDMFQISFDGVSWYNVPVSTPASSTPFPKESYAAAVYSEDDAVYVYGGINTRTDANVPAGRGSNNLYRTLHRSWNIQTWENLNSGDGGAGYRKGATMLCYRGNLFLFGGFNDADMYTQEYMNSCFKYDPLNFLFEVCCTDTLQKTSLTDPGGTDSSDYDAYVVGGCVWRDRMIILSSVAPAYKFFFWESKDGELWEPLHKVKLKVDSFTGTLATNNLVIKLYGDYTGLIKNGKTILSLYEGRSWKNHVRVNADPTYSSSTGLTSVSVTQLQMTNIEDMPSLSTDFWIYVHAMEGYIAMVDTVNFDRPQVLTSFLEKMFLTGGNAATNDFASMFYETKAINVTAGKVRLDNIVEDIVRRTRKLKPSDINTMDLIDYEIDGMVINTRPKAIDALTPIFQYALCDAINSDGKIYIIKRGKRNIAVSFVENDIGARLDSKRDDSTQRLLLTLKEVQKIAKIVEIIHPDPDLEYFDNFQIAKHGVGDYAKKNTIQTPLVLHAGEAFAMALRLLYEGHRSDPAVFSVKLIGLFYDPTDVFTVIHKSITYTFRITEIAVDLLGPVEFTAVMEDVSVYSQITTGGLTPTIPDMTNKMEGIGLTGLFLNLPALSSGDDDYGFYFGVYPTLAADESKWKGAELLALDGETYYSIEEVLDITLKGETSTEMSVASPNLIDRANTLTIVLPSYGELVSCSEDELLSGSNLALISHDSIIEIFQFQNATLITGSTYKVDTLLRGRFGTESSIVTHPVASTFILLDKIKRIAMDRIGYNSIISYKVIEKGLLSYSNIVPILFASTAASKKPFSPVDLNATKLGNGNWLLSWTRRARINNEWESGHDIPLDEAEEKYEVELLKEDSDEVEYEIGLDNLPDYFIYPVKVATKGGAQQPKLFIDDDLISSRNWIRFRVYQIGEYGRGFPSEIKEVLS